MNPRSWRWPDFLERVDDLPQQGGPVDDEALHRLAKQQLAVAARLVAVDEGQAEIVQHGADVVVLELDRSLAASAQQPAQPGVVLGLVVALPARLEQQHLEVVGHRRVDLLLAPVLADAHHLEAEAAQPAHDRLLPAGELLGLQRPFLRKLEAEGGTRHRLRVDPAAAAGMNDHEVARAAEAVLPEEGRPAERHGLVEGGEHGVRIGEPPERPRASATVHAKQARYASSTGS